MAAIASSGRKSVERRAGMKESPVDITLQWTPDIVRYSRSNLCEVFLDQRAQFGADLWALSEPQFEAAHRLVQQHAEAIGGLQSPRTRSRQQWRLQRHIDVT